MGSVSTMVARLQPEDELPHSGGEAELGECMDFFVYDIPVRLGGLFRLDSRPGQGYTRMTACLYLPDGRAAFVSERSGIALDSRFDAGGLRVEIVRPFQEVDVSYDGKLLVLEDPAAMLHPERSPSEQPQLDAEVDLTFSAISTLYEPTDDRGWTRRRGPQRPPGAPAHPSETAAGGHYEQLVSAFGSVRLGEERWDFQGLGLRGHRWGNEQAREPWYRRRMAANVGPSFGFMASHAVSAEGGERRRGFVWDGTALHVCSGLTIATSWSGVDRLARGVELTLKAGDQTWHASGKVLSLFARIDDDDDEEPLVRISEGFTEWRLDDGQVGYGLAEHVDRMVGGKPVGLAE